MSRKAFGVNTWSSHILEVRLELNQTHECGDWHLTGLWRYQARSSLSCFILIVLHAGEGQLLQFLG